MLNFHMQKQSIQSPRYIDIILIARVQCFTTNLFTILWFSHSLFIVCQGSRINWSFIKMYGRYTECFNINSENEFIFEKQEKSLLSFPGLGISSSHFYANYTHIAQSIVWRSFIANAFEFCVTVDLAIPKPTHSYPSVSVKWHAGSEAEVDRILDHIKVNRYGGFNRKFFIYFMIIIIKKFYRFGVAWICKWSRVASVQFSMEHNKDRERWGVGGELLNEMPSSKH